MRTDRHWLHQKLVAFARANGLKAAAREFGCSRNTVRKWLRRHVPGQPSALAERSRRPKHCPHQTPSSLEGVIVRLRKQTAFGAERLKHEFQLPVSHNAIARIIRQHKLSRPRKKKPLTKKQLRHVKRRWPIFGQLSTDTKYLQDIPHYWPQMTHLKLPRFQYTAREPVSGACFTGYADELSKSYATFLAEQLSVHLAGHGVDLSRLTWQTDNGCEFLENQDAQGLPRPCGRWVPTIVTSRPSVTPGRVMSKPFTGWLKMSSLIASPSPGPRTSGARPPLTGITSTWSGPIAARNGKALSKS